MYTDGPVEGSWLSLLLSPCPWPLPGKSNSTGVPHVSQRKPGAKWSIKQIESTLPLEPFPVFWMQLVFCPREAEAKDLGSQPDSSRRKDIMKNVIKQIMKLSPSHFTSFSLWFDYYCVRIFLWCYSLFSPCACHEVLLPWHLLLLFFPKLFAKASLVQNMQIIFTENNKKKPLMSGGLKKLLVNWQWLSKLLRSTGSSGKSMIDYVLIRFYPPQGSSPESMHWEMATKTSNWTAI